jgi:glyoxylase-like metal-dependent hydrolase (beta-lactamase superfamily II)
LAAYDHLRVEIGLSNGWIIRSGGGAVLVDAGFDRFASRVAWGLRHMGLRPRDLKLVVITHAHIDHIGALSDIVRGTGAAVAVHEREAGYVRTGVPLMPRGLSFRGRMTVAFGDRHPELTRVGAVEPQVIIKGDEELDLGRWGLAGRVVETPGHSPGSVSVVLDDGRAYVGDLVVNSFRPILSLRTSSFGDAPEELPRSWRRVLDLGARVICPGHGLAFPAARLRDHLARNSPEGG